jgi:hypothetical protein
MTDAPARGSGSPAPHTIFISFLYQLSFPACFDHTSRIPRSEFSLTILSTLCKGTVQEIGEACISKLCYTAMRFKEDEQQRQGNLQQDGLCQEGNGYAKYCG